MAPRVSVLFVCMGNICRSPAAEGVFRHLVKQAGLEDRIKIDSAGTIGYHAGEPADARMRAAAARRGYDLASRARRVRPADLREYDYILAADAENLADLRSLDRDGIATDRIRLLTDFHPDPAIDHVPDPYYGGPAGFEQVLDIVETCCRNLLEDVRRRLT